MDNQTLKSSLAELLGTFTLVFIGAFAVASGQGVVVAALAHGLTLTALIYTYGAISGAHVNPAVTLGLLIGGRIDTLKAVFYWIAQFVGGILAALLVLAIGGSRTALGETTGSLTASAPWLAALFEAVMTFFLVSAVYQGAARGKAGQLAGVGIGFTLAASILAGGIYTGASLNPARTLGPAVVAGNFSYLLPYLVGIFAGGALAGVLHKVLFDRD